MMCGAAAERVRGGGRETSGGGETMLDMDGCRERAARRSHDAALATARIAAYEKCLYTSDAGAA